MRNIAKLGRHLGNELAIVLDLKPRQLLGILGNQITESAQDCSPRGWMHRSPGPILKGAFGRRYGPLRILDTRSRYGRPGLAGKGVHGFEHPPISRLDPRTIDQILESTHPSLPSSPPAGLRLFFGVFKA